MLSKYSLLGEKLKNDWIKISKIINKECPIIEKQDVFGEERI